MRGFTSPLISLQDGFELTMDFPIPLSPVENRPRSNRAKNMITRPSRNWT